MLQATKTTFDITDVEVSNSKQLVISPEIKNKLQVITLSNPEALNTFGEETANVLKNLSNDMSVDSKLKDMGEVGTKINDLLKKAKSLDPSVLLAKPGFFGKLFGKIKDPIDTFANNQKSVSESVKQIAVKLLDDRKTLLADNVKLDKVYDSNVIALANLEQYIVAGNNHLETLREELRVLSTSQSDSVGLQIQTGKDVISRFEQRIDRLNSSRAIVLRQLPQIRIMQNSNFREAETIQDTVNTAIPVWEQQISLYITQLRTKLALENERSVNKMINETISASAALTHQNTVEIANASNNSLIDLSTIQTVQDNLIKSIDVMAATAETGRQKRLESFNAIALMDTQLKENLSKR
jgi:uncharacterized protein YaaN involved in tellurite resistance